MLKKTQKIVIKNFVLKKTQKIVLKNFVLTNPSPKTEMLRCFSNFENVRFDNVTKLKSLPCTKNYNAMLDIGSLEGLGNEHFWLWCSREFTAEEEEGHEDEGGSLSHYNCGTETSV